MAAFDNFSPKKYLRQMSILSTNKWKKSEQESHFCSVDFKSWVLGGFIFSDLLIVNP